MRVAAILFILLSVSANFYFNNPSSLVLAMFSFPLLVMLLLKKRKQKAGVKFNAPQSQTETADTSFDRMEEERNTK